MTEHIALFPDILHSSVQASHASEIQVCSKETSGDVAVVFNRNSLGSVGTCGVQMGKRMSVSGVYRKDAYYPDHWVEFRLLTTRKNQHSGVG